MMLFRAATGGRRASTLAASTATGAHWPCWIDNADAEAVGGATLPLENPATGRVVGSCAAGDAATIDAAVASSAAAFPGWRDLGAIGRGRVLRRAADLLRRDLPAVVDLETLHTGRPASEYVAQLGRVPEWLEYHASLAETSEGTLGGHAPVLVFDEADVDEAVDGAAFAAFVASGQTCVSAKRVLVQRSVAGEFAEKFARKAASLAVGDPFDAATAIGPLVSRKSLDGAVAHVAAAEAAGARVVAGGYAPAPGVLAGGHFYAPTILADATPAMACFQDECFAPVVALAAFDDEADAIRLANANAHGLGAGVWTRDVRRAHRVARALRSGVVWVNAHHRNAPDAPWGGFGKSGVGRENGRDAQREYTAAKTTVVRTADARRTVRRRGARYGEGGAAAQCPACEGRAGQGRPRAAADS
ncbi:aldehyde dehydrogenase [Aureococcus anophagefferens]|nr:aldehyde dehydrogenase [Aureococcus anophagefferens]